MNKYGFFDWKDDRENSIAFLNPKVIDTTRRIKMTDLMIVERFNDEEWKEIQFSELKEDDRFRMLDPDTKDLFIGSNNRTEFIAAGYPYMNDDEICTVNVKDEIRWEFPARY